MNECPGCKERDDKLTEVIHLRAKVRMIRQMIDRGYEAGRILAFIDTPRGRHGSRP